MIRITTHSREQKNAAETSKEVYSSKRAVFPVMVITNNTLNLRYNNKYISNRLIIRRLTQHRKMYIAKTVELPNPLSLIWVHIYNDCCLITILVIDKINL
jgi:hypothetical protein